MKKYIFLTIVAVLGFIACNKADKFQYGKEIALITGTDSSPISKDQILADVIPITYNYSISLTGPAAEDMKVHIQFDSLALVQYNQRNKTSYVNVPRKAFLIDDEYVTIKKGTATSAMTSVTMLDNTFVEEGVIYMIPLSVAYLENGGKTEILDASKSLFIKVGKTKESFSLEPPEEPALLAT